MAGHKNTFIKGMNQDTSKQKYPQNQYKDSRNLRPITDTGLSTGAMENIKGNFPKVSFPELNGFLEIVPSEKAYEDSGTLNSEQVTIMLNPISSGPIVFYAPYASPFVIDILSEFDTPKKYLDNIESAVTTYSNNLPPEQQFILHRSATSDRLIIESPIHPLMQTGPAEYGIFKVIKDQKNFTIIGSTNIRDKVILFTINDTSTAQDQAGMGQIWILEYDVEFPIEVNTLTLAYYGELNFSLEHPIEAIGNYENVEKQLVYWTDNFSPPRKIDVINPNSFSLFPDELLLNNKAQLHPALAGLEEQDGGALPTGILYLTYKLEKFGGSTTTTAPISAAIPITSDDFNSGGVDTNAENINYPLTTVGSNKSLRYLVPNIPKGYDKIYVYAIYEKDPDNYLAYLVEEQLLSNDPTFEFTLSSLGDKQKVQLIDLFTYDIDFERVKTMAVKDNQLLFGNIKQAAFSLDFDARAYRFRADTTQTYIFPAYTYGQKNWGVDLKKDVINPHNDDRTDVRTNPYRYQRDSALIGGTGPNISYRFIGRNLVLDQSGEAAPSNEEFNIGDGTPLYPDRTPIVNSPIQSTLNYPLRQRADETIVTDFGPGFQNYKNNRIEGYFKGYMKDEIYRFGIVFYSLTGRPSEVKWIGDIRMPSDGDIYSVSGNTSYSAQFHSEAGPSTDPISNIPLSTDLFRKNATMGTALGIRFDVDVSSISDQISGYSIVRAPRREKDRTIIAQGALNEVREASVPDPTPSDSDNRRNTLYNYTRVDDGLNNNTPDITTPGYATFDSPDLKFISGAKVDDYVDDDRDADWEAYYFKPVAGYSQICTAEDAETPDVTPTLVGNDLSRYSKSLANINVVDRFQRHEFAINGTSTNAAYGDGKITDILKIGANQIKVDIGNTTFDNRGYLILPLLNPTNEGTLASPGCQTIIVHNTNTKLFQLLGNSCFRGWSPNNNQSQTNNDGAYGAYSFGTPILFGGIARVGATAIVDLCRFLDKQYGGATYNDILNTEYISTGHYARVNPDDSDVGSEVYGGDIYINAFDEKKLYSYSERDPATGERVESEVATPIIGKIYPICGIINTDMRVGFHLNNLIQGAGGDIDLREEKQDDYLIPIMYHREKTLQKYLITGEGANLIAEYDTRVYISQPKTNGEFSDSWSSIKPLNYKDVDGAYGPINKLAILNDRAMWWQDKGFGQLSVNPRAVVQSLDGAELEMGTGRNITDYTYISNSTGAFHQWGVIKGVGAIYWFDAVHRKFCRFSNKLEILSNSKHMSSFFNNTVADGLLNTDNPILFQGVTGTYDNKFNEIIMTFHSNPKERYVSNIEEGQSQAIKGRSFNETIVYNENIDAFSSFYDHFPRHYVNDGRNIFSQNDIIIGTTPNSDLPIEDTIYIHDHSDRTTFYETYFPCKLDLIINPKGDHTKVFNNLEFFTEVEDENSSDVFNETLTQAKYFNEYQNTGTIILTPDVNVQRRMRTWRTAIPRDTSGTNSRLRNPNIQIELEFTRIDDEDKRLVIHDIITHYMDVPM